MARSTSIEIIECWLALSVLVHLSDRSREDDGRRGRWTFSTWPPTFMNLVNFFLLISARSYRSRSNATMMADGCASQQVGSFNLLPKLDRYYRLFAGVFGFHSDMIKLSGSHLTWVWQPTLFSQLVGTFIWWWILIDAFDFSMSLTRFSPKFFPLEWEVWNHFLYCFTDIRYNVRLAV